MSRLNVMMRNRDSEFKLLNPRGYLLDGRHIEIIRQILSTLQYSKSIYQRLTFFSAQ